MSDTAARSTDAESPPFVDKHTEQMILGSCLVWRPVAPRFAAAGLREAHFFSLHHAAVWRRIRQALDERIPVAWETVRNLLIRHHELEEVTDGYLLGLTNLGALPFEDDAAHVLTRRLVECAAGRQTLDALTKARARLIEHPELLTEGFFGDLTGAFAPLQNTLRGRRMPEHVSHISEVMAEVRASLEAGPQTFIDTPWPALNTMLGGGFAPGELVYFGARPGLGKTAAALEIARRTAKRGSSVFVVSREMLKLAIGMRMVAQEGPVNATALRRKGESLTPSHWRTIGEAFEQLEALPIFMTHARIDIDEIRRLVGILADEAPLGLVVIDYLQLIGAPEGVNERRLQVEAVSAGVKAITIDYGVPVLCLSSLSRSPENKRPTLASLRESGNLEHDADTVILLHRPDELDPDTEVIVCKARNGWPGLINLYFRGEYLRFEETSRAYAG